MILLNWFSSYKIDEQQFDNDRYVLLFSLQHPMTTGSNQNANIQDEAQY